MMQWGVYGQTLPIDGKMWRGGWAKLWRKEVILCGNFPLSCQHVSQDDQGRLRGSIRKWKGGCGGSSKKECLECLDESVPVLTVMTKAMLEHDYSQPTQLLFTSYLCVKKCLKSFLKSSPNHWFYFFFCHFAKPGHNYLPLLFRTQRITMSSLNVGVAFFKQWCVGKGGYCTTVKS